MFHLQIRCTFTIFVFLTEQWARNADSRVDMPSCQLASLGPIPDAVMDEINECILLEGAQDGSEMRVGAGVHDDVASMTCIHSVALRRFGVDAPKGTGTESINLSLNIMNHK